LAVDNSYLSNKIDFLLNSFMVSLRVYFGSKAGANRLLRFFRQFLASKAGPLARQRPQDSRLEDYANWVWRTDQMPVEGTDKM
jgi:hypothetical protein